MTHKFTLGTWYVYFPLPRDEASRLLSGRYAATPACVNVGARADMGLVHLWNEEKVDGLAYGGGTGMKPSTGPKKAGTKR